MLLIACVVPAFLGESHFAFLGYSLNFRQTPVRRQLDYLRVLGASKESAKELKLFGLSSFFIRRYARLVGRHLSAERARWRGGGFGPDPRSRLLSTRRLLRRLRLRHL